MTHQVLVQILADVGGQLHRPDEDEEDAQQDGQGLEHDRAHLRHGDGSSFSLSHLHPCVYLLPSITDGTLQRRSRFLSSLGYMYTQTHTSYAYIYLWAPSHALLFGHPQAAITTNFSPQRAVAPRASFSPSGAAAEAEAAASSARAAAAHVCTLPLSFLHLYTVCIRAYKYVRVGLTDWTTIDEGDDAEYAYTYIYLYSRF